MSASHQHPADLQQKCALPAAMLAPGRSSSGDNASEHEVRASGIEVIGAAPWGTHFCQFYQDQSDLIEILVPYFRAGLEANEFCMWVTSQPLGVEKAKAALARALPEIDVYLKRGQLEILDYSEWYTLGGTFESDRVLQGWVDKLEAALQRGHSGLRLTGNTFWLEDADWDSFKAYEAAVDGVLGKYRMLALCTYSLEKCGAAEIMDVVSNHAFALVKRNRRWQIIESAERKKAQEALRESEQRYATTLCSIGDGVIATDSAGCITFMNPVAEQLTGWTTRDAVGRPVAEVFKIINEQTRRSVENPVAKVLQTGMIAGLANHTLLQRRDGSEVPIDDSGAPIRDTHGQIAGVVLVFRDITERRQAEAKLDRDARRKDDFLALLGHELRNPLAPIRNALHLIRKAGKNTEAVERACAIVERQVTHMVRLVDDLLDISRITRGKIELKQEYMDLVETVRGVMTDYQPILDDNRLRLDFSGPAEAVSLVADKARVIQIVSNLLHNSAKFTDPGGHISVRAETSESGWCQIVVKDTGTGIPSALLSTIFEPFMQAKETIGRSRGGLGLGLALVKGLVELHGGTVSVHSEGAGKGAEFTVRLPVSKVVEKPVLHGSATQSVGTYSGRVLIVEDNADAAESLQLVLQLAGHQVEVASDGESGLAKVHAFRPDVVLCDIGLPGQYDGYEVARKIRASELKDVCLVALTGFGQAEDKSRAQEAGFDSYLTKPIDPEALEQMLARLLQNE